MSIVTVIDNLPKFAELTLQAWDRSLNRMAIDIERLSKAQVPVGPTKKQSRNSHSSGQLRSSGHHMKLGFLSYITYYNMEYARYQEFGGDGKRTVRHYTKAGTGSFYLKNPGDLIASKALEYFMNETSKIVL